MDYEQKYKKALERAREELGSGCFDRGTVEYIFPELKESDDERISREITEFILTHRIDEPNDIEDTNSWLVWLEKQGEQKSIDKVDSKFEIEKGKWYVCNTPRYADFIVGKAYYCPKNGMLRPNENEMARYVARDCFHPWSIADAKDGDVLASAGCIFIFKKIKDDWIYCYCLLHPDGSFIPETYNLMTIKYSNEVYPATLEECEKLEKATKEAGYEWDVEKKKLRKIENSPILSNSSNIGKDLQVDGFDAELNALLKKYEHLPKEEILGCLNFYVLVLGKEMEQQ